MICTPVGSKCRLLCVARVWPWKRAVAAIKESSHVIVRFLTLRSASNSFHRTNTGSVVDQHGNRVPTGQYVNSAGNTITYTMD